MRSPECFHSLVHRVCGRTGGKNPEQLTAAVALDPEPVAGQRLAQNEAAELEREVGDAYQATGLLMEVRNVKQPAAWLAARMFARDAIQPALNAAGQPEIGRIDGQNQRAVDDAAVEPVGQDELHALDTAMRRG